MAAAADADCLEKSIECPVCFDVLRQPKQLTCGHAVCTQCSRQLPLTPVHYGSVIQCPICRFGTVLQFGQNTLRTNFALANVVEQIEEQKKKRCHKCVGCGEENESKNMFICGTCDGICSCARCIIITHRDHRLEALGAHINIQYIRMQKWTKETVKPELQTRESGLHQYTRIQSLCDSTKTLLDQLRCLSGDAANLVHKSWNFRMGKLDRMSNQQNNNLSARNGYCFDFAALEQEFKAIGEECKMMENGHRDMMVELEGFRNRLNAMVMRANNMRHAVNNPESSVKEKCSV